MFIVLQVNNVVFFAIELALPIGPNNNIVTNDPN